MADIIKGIAPQKDTYANWVTLDPTLGKDFDGNSYSQMIFATGSPVGNILLWGNAEKFTVAYAAGQFVIQGNDDGNIIGSEKKFFTYKDRTAQGYLPFAFDNAVSTLTTYALLYADVGDIFEQQHLDAGDSASGVDMFYPTPVPGGYDRAGIPDSEFTDTDINTGTDRIVNLTGGITNNRRNGTPVYFKKVGSGTLPTTSPQIDEDTVYYIFFTSTDGQVRLHTSEADAVANTSFITISNSGSGTFRLTQEGILLDDAVEDLEFRMGSGGALDNEGRLSGEQNGGAGVVSETKNTSDLINTGRITNETRPKTNHMYPFIKAFHI